MVVKYYTFLLSLIKFELNLFMFPHMNIEKHLNKANLVGNQNMVYNIFMNMLQWTHHFLHLFLLQFLPENSNWKISEFLAIQNFDEKLLWILHSPHYSELKFT